MSLTTPKRGRPRGQPKAERRLRRELARNQALLDLVGTVRELGVEFTHTATANKVVGAVAAVVFADILHRLRVISDLGYAASLALIGGIEVANATTQLAGAIDGVIASISGLIPGHGILSTSTPATPANPDLADNYTDARGRPQAAHKGIGVSDVAVRP